MATKNLTKQPKSEVVKEPQILNESKEQKSSIEVRKQISFSPLPPPEDLAYYKQTDPSLPDRMMTMAEKNAQSRRIMNYLGLFSALVPATFSFLVALGGIYLASIDKQLTGSIITLFGGSATALQIYFTKRGKKE